MSEQAKPGWVRSGGIPDWGPNVWALDLGPLAAYVTANGRTWEVQSGEDYLLDGGECTDLADGKRQAIAAARTLHRELGEALDALEADNG